MPTHGCIRCPVCGGNCPLCHADLHQHGQTQQQWSIASTFGTRAMTMGDIDRLRGDAPKSTHLARYERAHDDRSSSVLDVQCPHCYALPTALCGEN